MMTPDESEEPDTMRLALLAMLMVAEAEGELVYADDTPCEVIPEAAATAWLLSQANLTLAEAVAYLRFEGHDVN